MKILNFFAFLFLISLFSCIRLDNKPVTITFSDWHLTEDHWEKSLKEAFDLYQKIRPDINIELIPVSYTDKEIKYTAEIEAGSGPDIIHLHAYSVRGFIENGYAMELTKFINREKKNFINSWYPQTIEILKKDNRYYALPGDFMSMVLFYNKNLFIKAGLDPQKPPATWDEFLDYAVKLTRDTNNDGKTDTWGFGLIGAINPGFELRYTPVLYSHGGSYLTGDNKCSLLNSEESIETLKFLTDLVIKYKVVPPDIINQTHITNRKQMANEQIAMKIGSGWTPPIVSGLNPSINFNDILMAAPIPVKKGYTGKRTTAWLSAWMINKNTKNPEEAWNIIKFITSKQMEEKWFKDARVLSSRKDVSGQYSELLNDKFARVISAELDNAKFVPQLKEWTQIIELVNVAAQEAFTGVKSPEEALKDAHDKTNGILNIYRKDNEVCK